MLGEVIITPCITVHNFSPHRYTLENVMNPQRGTALLSVVFSTHKANHKINKWLIKDAIISDTCTTSVGNQKATSVVSQLRNVTGYPIIRVIQPRRKGIESLDSTRSMTDWGVIETVVSEEGLIDETDPEYDRFDKNLEITDRATDLFFVCCQMWR